MRALAVAAVLLAAGPARAQLVKASESDPYPGIHRETWQDTAAPVRLRLVQIDLTSAEIAVYATKEADRGVTTSELATRLSAQVAINGDAFAVNGYVPRGLAIGDQAVWSNTSDDVRSAVFTMRRAGERTVAAIIPPEIVVTPGDLPPGTEGVVSGRPLLVRQSQVAASFDCSDPVTIACQHAPRSAVAVSADGNTLWLVVVDGWQAGSRGMTAAELAEFLRVQGAGMAMALDGGSSSTLVIGGAVVSSPSDGVERAVANHIAVKYGQLPKGEMYGLICRHSVVGCSGDPAKYITGATVRLDDGRVQTSAAGNGSYSFINVTARLACVTVQKEGYVSKTQCRQIIPGDITYNSVALWEGVDPPDAGVGEDGGVPGDAGVVIDALPGDGGTGYDDPGGGCCQTGSDRPEGMLVVLAAWFLVRRRGTTSEA
jgi:exopolysaccharide biosynthesis protein